LVQPIDPNAARPIEPVVPGSVSGTGPVKNADGKTFNDVLAESIQEVNRMQLEADTAIEKLATGEIKDLSEVVSAVEKADLAFSTLMQIRNRLVEAYQEIMRIRT